MVCARCTSRCVIFDPHQGLRRCLACGDDQGDGGNADTQLAITVIARTMSTRPGGSDTQLPLIPDIVLEPETVEYRMRLSDGHLNPPRHYETSIEAK